MDQFNTNQPNQVPPQQPSPAMPSAMMTEPESKASAGPIIGSVIIVLVLILAGVYFYGTSWNKSSDMIVPTAPTNTASDTSSAAVINSQGTTDDINSIKQDLNVDISNVGASESANISNTLSQ